jgi:hypothetical protein
VGVPSPNVLLPELGETPVAQASTPLENPTTVTRPDGTTVTAALTKPFKNGWRLFYTQQHGDNFTWELLPNPGCDAPFDD